MAIVLLNDGLSVVKEEQNEIKKKMIRLKKNKELWVININI